MRRPSTDCAGVKIPASMGQSADALWGRTPVTGIFEGLKVIDCASFIAAPAAATVLSDFGAEVIKIEPPGAGDPYRRLSELPGYPPSPHNYVWLLESRNKKSLALDLSKPEGQAV